MYNGNTTLSQVVQKLHATYYYKSIYSLDQRFPIFFPQNPYWLYFSQQNPSLITENYNLVVFVFLFENKEKI